MRKTRIFRIAAITLTTCILIIIGIGLCIVYRGDVLLPALPLSLAKLDVKADKVSYTHTDGNGRRWTLEANTALYDRDRQKALLNRIRVTFYSQGEEVLFLTANEGELQAGNKLMTVRGDVVARSAPDTVLRTQSLVYRGKTGLITTQDPVDIKTTRMQIKGIGMTLDLESQRMQIHRSIQSRMIGVSLWRG
ncbi:MAG: LPS export ABC transporter periplasmic protein LptC [Deltaproteobacteria bacterium]|nr:LPS export ABC transporter periplasmic protein LptC [Deltaproteobacteria bacterium]